MDESSYNNNNKCVAAYFSGVAIATIAQMWLPSGTSKSERASIHMYNNEREKKVRHRRLWKRQQQQRWAKSRTKAYTFKSVWNRKKKSKQHEQTAVHDGFIYSALYGNRWRAISQRPYDRTMNRSLIICCLCRVAFFYNRFSGMFLLFSVFASFCFTHRDDSVLLYFPRWFYLFPPINWLLLFFHWPRVLRAPSPCVFCRLLLILATTTNGLFWL